MLRTCIYRYICNFANFSLANVIHCVRYLDKMKATVIKPQMSYSTKVCDDDSKINIRSDQRNIRSDHSFSVPNIENNLALDVFLSLIIVGNALVIGYQADSSNYSQWLLLWEIGFVMVVSGEVWIRY